MDVPEGFEEAVEAVGEELTRRPGVDGVFAGLGARGTLCVTVLASGLDAQARREITDLISARCGNVPVEFAQGPITKQ